jgi:membrane-associated protease RseP (regulator of RpoE activity)
MRSARQALSKEVRCTHPDLSSGANHTAADFHPTGSIMTSLRNVARRLTIAGAIASLSFVPFGTVLEAQAPARVPTQRLTAATPASSGCAGVSWARMRTAEGVAFPEVTQVEKSSPADQAGLRTGDLIIAVNGKDARTLDSWFVAAPGESVSVTIERAGKRRDVQLTAGRVLDLAPTRIEMQCQRMGA